MKNLKNFNENKAVLSVKGGADGGKTKVQKYSASAATSRHCEDTKTYFYEDNDNGGRLHNTGKVITDYYCC